MLTSPRRPSSTMRIFSSAECCRRVALRISRTVFSALSGMRLLACLIVAPQQGYDEPGIVSYAIRSFCPISADGLQQHLARSIGGCGCEPVRFQTECLFSPINHDSRRCHLVIGACRRGLNVDNHSMP